MERETYTSKELLIEEFSRIANTVKERYKVNIQLVEILGKRWSFISGEEEEFSFLPPERIQISERFGVVSNEWKKIPPEDKKKIISLLKKVVKRYEQG